MTQETKELQSSLTDLQISEKHRNEHLEFMSRMFSHNLRSPVSGLKMLYGLLEMVEGEEREDVINNLKGGSEVLFGMIDDLAEIFLDYRILVKEREDVSFKEVLNGVKSDLDELLSSSGGEIISDLREPKIFYHLEHLRIILTELITNSIKFTPEGRTPRIEIKTYTEGNKVMLSLADNACGMDLERHGKDVFKMHKPLQGDGGKSGKGAGLFRVKNIVEINGGKVEIFSTPGEGTEFKLELCRTNC